MFGEITSCKKYNFQSIKDKVRICFFCWKRQKTEVEMENGGKFVGKQAVKYKENPYMGLMWKVRRVGKLLQVNEGIIERRMCKKREREREREREKDSCFIPSKKTCQ